MKKTLSITGSWSRKISEVQLSGLNWETSGFQKKFERLPVQLWDLTTLAGRPRRVIRTTLTQSLSNAEGSDTAVKFTSADQAIKSREIHSLKTIQTDRQYQ